MAEQRQTSEVAVRDAIAAMFPQDAVVEVRVLCIGGRDGANALGWFDDHAKLAREVVQYDLMRPEGIYVVLNELPRDLLARGAPNQMQDRPRRGFAAADHLITRRRWLLLDFDPERISGVSSTTQELTRAREVAESARTWLKSEVGWPEPLVGMSGNGVHLLYRIDLPNDEASTNLVQASLQAVAQNHDCGDVRIDQTVFNSSRISKLFGTVARKGAHTSSRPHRRSFLWSEGPPKFDDVAIVRKDALNALLSHAKPTVASVTATSRKKTKRVAAPSMPSGQKLYFDLDGFVERYGIAVEKKQKWRDGIRYILRNCVFNPEHTRTSAAIGRTGQGKIYYACQHQSCKDKAWKDVRAHFDKTFTPQMDEGGEGILDTPWNLAIWCLSELYTDHDTGEVLLRRHRQTYYLYHPSEHVYHEQVDDDIRVEVTKALGDAIEKVTRTKVGDIMSAISSLVTIPGREDLPFWTQVSVGDRVSRTRPASSRSMLALRNGIVDLDSILAGNEFGKCLLPHSANWLSTTTLPYDFPETVEQMQCPNWKAFLNEVLDEDQARVAILQEVFGYCFLNSAKYHKFVLLVGSGANGKSTAMDVLIALLGDEHVTSLTPDQLAENKMRGDLYGKLANICSDLPRMDTVEEGLLKALVSGDKVTADRKYKTSLRFRSSAKFIFATNSLPRWGDNTQGLWRRMLLVPFDFVVPVPKRDPDLCHKKLLPELPGIFLWSLEGLAQLTKTGRFTQSDYCEQHLRQYRRYCYPILAFLDECTETAGTTSARELWDAYRQWCGLVGFRKVKALDAFLDDVRLFRRDEGVDVDPTVTPTMKRDQVWSPIRVRPGIDLSGLHAGSEYNYQAMP